MAPYHNITTAELSQFLDDVAKNVSHDENTDFKKLLLYLFGFTNVKLLELTTNPLPENVALTARLFDCIDMVLTSKKHLLNTLVTSDELKAVLDGSTVVAILPTSTSSPSTMIYEWSVHFACSWLPKFPESLEITNLVKSFLMALVNNITVHLHAFRYKKHLRTILVDLVEANVAKLFEYMPLISLKDDFATVYAPLLASGVHLFTVVNDYDITHKLALHDVGTALRFDAIARKLEFIFSSTHLDALLTDAADPKLKLVDNLRSVLLLNMTYNLLLDSNTKWSQIDLLLRWIHAHFESFKASPRRSLMKSYNRATCSCIMKIYTMCRDKSLLANFYNSFQMHGFLVGQPLDANDPPGSVYPPSILKVLNVLHFQFSILINPDEAQAAAEKYSLASAAFADKEHNWLRELILNQLPGTVTNTLKFIVLSKFLFQQYRSQKRLEKKDISEISQWLDYVMDVIYRDGKSPGTRVFESRMTFYTFITALQYVPCIINEDFDFESGTCTKCDKHAAKNIYLEVSAKRKQINEQFEANVLYTEIVCGFILRQKMKELNEDPLLASNFLLMLCNLFLTFRPSKTENDPCLQFVLQCLSESKNRDVRILASRVLPLFIIRDFDETLEVIFRHIFQSVSIINYRGENGRIYLAESSLLALSELAVVSEGEWLCVIFFKLIDAFGESNEQHVNLAHNCVLYVAAAKSVTPYKLLSPFLPSMAERIIRNPRMFSRLTELLRISKKYFLNNTRDYTTPRLLEYYQHDFIQEIADASNMDKAKLMAKTLPRIMATYLCKDDRIDMGYIMNVLRNASPSYQNVTITELIDVGEVLWYILLQMQFDEKGRLLNEKRIFAAIIYVAKVHWANRAKYQGTVEGRPDKDSFDYVKYVLGDHVLELVRRFSENVHHVKGIKPYLEKVGSLKAMQFLISRDIDAASSALGQISTCLQASLENKSLEIPAIECWNVLVQNLKTRHLVSLFDISISLIFQKFASFQHKSKLIATEILNKLFLELRDYNKYALYYFSVPFIKDLDKYFFLEPSVINSMRPKSKLSYFPEFARRLQTNNKYVVHQALDDLLNFTNKYQESCQREEFRDTANEECLSVLMRNLLDISVQFKTKTPAISTKCAKAIASIGALDSNRFNFKTIKSQIIILHDFHDYNENSEFLCNFIKEKVIKNFWASNDPFKQLFSAYSMQEFLKVMGLKESILGPESQGYLSKVWNSFSDIDKSTLTPLLTSKYMAPNPRYEPIEYPIYRLGMRYDKWLVDFTVNLVRRPFPHPPRKSDPGYKRTVIFETCSMLIRDEEISISQHILKYVALSHIVNGDEKAKADILNEFLSILNTSGSLASSSERIENLKLCFQAVFEVIDYFNEWVSAATQKLSDTHLSKTDLSYLKRNKSYVQAFLKEIPMELIAVTSSECDSYERTILYLEKCYRDGKVEKNNKLDNLSIASTLQSVYSNIDDFDALDGVLKKFSTSNLAEKLDTFQYNENWSIAQESFQVLSKIGGDSERVEYNTKLLKSLADHALYDKVLSTLESKYNNGTISQMPIAWATVGLRAAIASGESEQIRKWQMISGSVGRAQDVESVVNSKFSEALLSIDGNQHNFDNYVEQIYELIGQSLSLSMSSSFSRNSNLMTLLHVVFDTSLIASALGEVDPNLQTELELVLKERLANTDLSFDNQWRILSVHRVANTLTKNNAKISEILLKGSEIARRSDRFDIATKSIMNAMVLNDQLANVEYAHLLWDEGKQTEAIKTLSENLPKRTSSNVRKGATTQLQYALWLDESSHSSSATIIAEYTKAFKFDPTWEKPYFELGKYYSKVMESRNDTSGTYEQEIVRFYLKALGLGPTYIFEALPKFITVWLDFAQRPNKSRDAERRLNQIVQDIQSYRLSIPVYVWYTSITQLLSRITHKHPPSAEMMLQIIELLVRTYPKHSLWYVLSHLKSKDLNRREKVTRILHNVQSDRALSASIINAKELFEILEKLASHKIKKLVNKRWFLNTDFGIEDLTKRYDSLVIPVKSNLEIRLPAGRHTNKANLAFPKSASITFDGFNAEVNVFHSLQKPKQITIRGTDIRPYRLMVKRDDTRKDAKVFEFTNMINRLLSANADARKRNLVIENYSVIPLAEDMGVIEFVQDVATMKSVIHHQQVKTGHVVNERKLFEKLADCQKGVKALKDPESLNTLVDFLRNYVSKLHQSSINAVWYLARKGYTTTAAVMSIVGYVVGLGDRHCENILFFKKNGKALHIDFDCLFDKGATLPTPEIVPFRLTQNMVDAMGITGIEGTFRITCEVTAQLVRENEASLMNILETLIYDPLLDWKTQDNPQDHLRKVRRKIRGLLDEKEGLPMNVHGQVDVLIQEAITTENLSQMYGGWAPYV
ncbi:CIC11C00000001106 [Sungouiella intermedia]|uniref:Serine/threonine-protein kinase MEC1 n=1 Tax=Sungouiella intermedia TaxID=45354 RepID=A0A1L0BLT0_9ASCO|nr:CIC11C00000001106 [[Candida] intermedia]